MRTYAKGCHNHRGLRAFNSAFGRTSILVIADVTTPGTSAVPITFFSKVG